MGAELAARRATRKAVTMSTSVEKASAGNLAVAREGATQVERWKAFTRAIEVVDDPRCPRPIPRFMLDMPWVQDPEAIQDSIIVQMLASDDPDEFQLSSGTESGKDLVGRKVTVHNVQAFPSKKPGGWGAYLMLDAEVDGDPVRRPISTGAKQAVARLALAFFTGQLPITGTFTVVGTPSPDGNTPIGFVAERAL